MGGAAQKNCEKCKLPLAILLYFCYTILAAWRRRLKCLGLSQSALTASEYNEKE